MLTKKVKNLLLASSSPRRIELLNQIGIQPFDISPANIEEIPLKNELPIKFAERMALEKAEAICKTKRDFFILSADTIVAVGRRIIGKPKDSTEARIFLNLLSGRRHRVYTSVVLYNPLKNKFHQKTEYTHIKMKRLHPEEISAYLSTSEWKGKAGAYGIQGFASCFIEHLNGSYSTVLGLPLNKVYALLSSNNLMP